jgi:hypothetical protein
MINHCAGLVDNPETTCEEFDETVAFFAASENGPAAKAFVKR